MPNDELTITDDKTGRVYHIGYENGKPPSDDEIRAILADQTKHERSNGGGGIPAPTARAAVRSMDASAPKLPQAITPRTSGVAPVASRPPRRMGNVVEEAGRTLMGVPLIRNVVRDADGITDSILQTAGDFGQVVTGGSSADFYRDYAAGLHGPVKPEVRARALQQEREQRQATARAGDNLLAIPGALFQPIKAGAERLGKAAAYMVNATDDRPPEAAEQFGNMARRELHGAATDAKNFAVEHPVQTALLAADGLAVGAGALKGRAPVVESPNPLRVRVIEKRPVPDLESPGAKLPPSVYDFDPEPNAPVAPPEDVAPAPAPAAPIVPPPVAPPVIPLPQEAPPRRIMPVKNAGGIRLVDGPNGQTTFTNPATAPGEKPKPAPVAPPVSLSPLPPGSAPPVVSMPPVGPVPPQRPLTPNPTAGNVRLNGPGTLRNTIAEPGVGPPKPAPPAAPPKTPLARAGVVAQKTAAFGQDLLRLPSVLKTSWDLSAPLRQGAPISIARPRAAARAMGDMFRSLATEKGYKAAQEAIQARPNVELYKQAGVEFTGMAGNGLSLPEEAYASRIAEYVPGVKHSERAYTAYLNRLRADVFDQSVKPLQNVPMTVAEYDKAVKSLGRYVNAATGRGDLGKFTAVAEPLSGVIWAPRLMASRVQLLNPIEYARMPKAVRVQALRDMATGAGTMGAVLMAGKLSGHAEVSTDWRDSDAYKLKIGDTRVDLGAGFLQYIRLAVMLAKSERITSYGNVKKLDGKGDKAESQWSTVGKFLEERTTPPAGLVIKALRGWKDADGRDVKLSDEAIKSVTPIILSDLREAYKADPKTGGVVTLPAIFGAGVSTYHTAKDDKKKGGKGGGSAVPRPARLDPGTDE